MRPISLFFASLVIAAPAAASDSLFAKLVQATQDSNWDALKQLLEMEALSTSTISVGPDNRLIAGSMRHGVSATEMAEKLTNCTIDRWTDEGSKWSSPFVSWKCPTKRVAGNDCYFPVYRASFLDPRFHPASLFIHELPSRDTKRCGSILPPPPKP